jgi:hypothetical protein
MTEHAYIRKTKTSALRVTFIQVLEDVISTLIILIGTSKLSHHSSVMLVTKFCCFLCASLPVVAFSAPPLVRASIMTSEWQHLLQVPVAILILVFFPIFQHPVAWYFKQSMCVFPVRNATNLLIPPFHSLDTLHDMFWPTWPSSGVWTVKTARLHSWASHSLNTQHVSAYMTILRCLNCQNCHTALTSVLFTHKRTQYLHAAFCRLQITKN